MHLPRLKTDINTALKIAGAGAAVLVVVFLVWLNRRTVIEVRGEETGISTSSVGVLTGALCPESARRPMAVMLASDPIARPLSGIASADLVVEMPVTPDGVTRMMAMFQCQTPQEIGSVRSAREDFIPLAAGYGAILAHWGGEHEALAKLNAGIIDNIDALRYEGTAYYRKKSIPQPHNGFTKIENLYRVAEERNYSLAATFAGYLHVDAKNPSRSLGSLTDQILIPYRAPYDVTWTYDVNTNTYARLRNGRPEEDAEGETVGAEVVVALKANIVPLYEQYVSVNLAGKTGEATVYQNGGESGVTWSKGATISDPLAFSGPDGKPFAFTPGTLWIEIIPDTGS